RIGGVRRGRAGRRGGGAEGDLVERGLLRAQHPVALAALVRLGESGEAVLVDAGGGVLVARGGDGGRLRLAEHTEVGEQTARGDAAGGEGREGAHVFDPFGRGRERRPYLAVACLGLRVLHRGAGEALGGGALL